MYASLFACSPFSPNFHDPRRKVRSLYRESIAHSSIANDHCRPSICEKSIKDFFLRIFQKLAVLQPNYFTGNKVKRKNGCVRWLLMIKKKLKFENKMWNSLLNNLGWKVKKNKINRVFHLCNIVRKSCQLEDRRGACRSLSSSSLCRLFLRARRSIFCIRRPCRTKEIVILKNFLSPFRSNFLGIF